MISRVRRFDLTGDGSFDQFCREQRQKVRQQLDSRILTHRRKQARLRTRVVRESASWVLQTRTGEAITTVPLEQAPSRSRRDGSGSLDYTEE